MIKKRATVVWKNFFILISFISILIICITFFIYRNAISVMKEEICTVNMNQASQLENNMIALIEQTNRLAASLCVQQESISFWGIDEPELLDKDFYTELGSALKGYVYSMSNSISSIVLYAPAYNRVISQNMNSPHFLVEEKVGSRVNTGWIEYLEEPGQWKVKDNIVIRALHDSYPYVMTFMKQYVVGNKWGAVAVDIDLEKAYSAIWPKNVEDTTVWVLDKEGSVIIRNRKNELYADVSQFPELALFTTTPEEVSVIWEEGEKTASYAQRYNAEYELYIVSVSDLEDFNSQMRVARMEAISVGISCVIIACLLVWLYVTFASKPLMSILGLLQNPMNYHDYIKQSDKEVQEIVDYIVSNIQTNNALQVELEKRMEILNKTRLQALKAQINPHFLFNTLNVIVMLIDAEVEDSKAAQVTADLADVLHYSLSDQELVLLSDEIEHTRKCVYILEQRYKGRFHAEFHIESELLEIKVPKLMLQPLIENAVFHGIIAKDMSTHGVLFISGCKQKVVFEQGELWAVRIDIMDNGKGMSQEEIEKVKILLDEENISMNHIGIQNVAKRLALLFPHRSKIEIHSKQGEGTCISLFFPFTKM